MNPCCRVWGVNPKALDGHYHVCGRELHHEGFEHRCRGCTAKTTNLRPSLNDNKVGTR